MGGCISHEPAIPSFNITLKEKDWGSLPVPILTIIFSHVLPSDDKAEAQSVVQAWQNLALVNHHWCEAALDAPFCLSLGSNITGEAAAWLSKRSFKSLKFALELPTNAAHAQRDLAIISNPEFRYNNHHTLRALLNIGIHCLDKDILSNFKGLQHLSIYSHESALAENVGSRISATDFSIPLNIGSILGGLDQLECLDIAGHISCTPRQWRRALLDLPGTVTSLSISLLNPTMLFAVVPTASKTLKFARFDGYHIAVDWYCLVRKVEQLEVWADAINPVIKMSASEMPPDKDSPQSPRSIGEMLSIGLNDKDNVLQQATLAFKRIDIMLKEKVGDDDFAGRTAIIDCDINMLDEAFNRVLKGYWCISRYIDSRPHTLARPWGHSKQVHVLKLVNLNNSGPKC